MALNRGAALLSGRHRLISEQDYIREVMSFSGGIDQVKCVCGKNGSISLVLLMKDFEEGSYSTGPGSGHEIGALPGEQQIVTMLYSVPFNGRISRFAVTACYTDPEGEHETDISRMRQNPFVVCMNGNHTIHLAQA